MKSRLATGALCAWVVVISTTVASAQSLDQRALDQREAQIESVRAANDADPRLASMMVDFARDLLDSLATTGDDIAVIHGLPTESQRQRSIEIARRAELFALEAHQASDRAVEALQDALFTDRNATEQRARAIEADMTRLIDIEQHARIPMIRARARILNAAANPQHVRAKVMRQEAIMLLGDQQQGGSMAFADPRAEAHRMLWLTRAQLLDNTAHGPAAIRAIGKQIESNASPEDQRIISGARVIRALAGDDIKLAQNTIADRMIRAEVAAVLARSRFVDSGGRDAETLTGALAMLESLHDELCDIDPRAGLPVVEKVGLLFDGVGDDALPPIASLARAIAIEGAHDGDRERALLEHAARNGITRVATDASARLASMLITSDDPAELVRAAQMMNIASKDRPDLTLAAARTALFAYQQAASTTQSGPARDAYIEALDRALTQPELLDNPRAWKVRRLAIDIEDRRINTPEALESTLRNSAQAAAEPVLAPEADAAALRAIAMLVRASPADADADARRNAARCAPRRINMGDPTTKPDLDALALEEAALLRASGDDTMRKDAAAIIDDLSIRRALLVNVDMDRLDDMHADVLIERNESERAFGILRSLTTRLDRPDTNSSAARPDLFWRSWLRMTTILRDADNGSRTTAIKTHINRLKLIDPTMGGHLKSFEHNN